MCEAKFGGNLACHYFVRQKSWRFVKIKNLKSVNFKKLDFNEIWAKFQRNLARNLKGQKFKKPNFSQRQVFFKFTQKIDNLSQKFIAKICDKFSKNNYINSANFKFLKFSKSFYFDKIINSKKVVNA